jgi:hypothetical protein
MELADVTVAGMVNLVLVPAPAWRQPFGTALNRPVPPPLGSTKC